MLKTNERIGFLIPENIRIDILFMYLAYVGNAKTMLKTNERIGFLIPENIRIDILFMSLASQVF